MINHFDNLNTHYHIARTIMLNNHYIEKNGVSHPLVEKHWGITGYVDEIVEKGARFSGKTYSVSDIILEDMLEDTRLCAIVIMPTQKDHFGKTLRAFESTIDRLDKKQKGLKHLFRIVRDKTLLRIDLTWPNGHKQEIRFISLEEAHSAGSEPLPNTAFKILWGEELTSSDERTKDMFEEKEALLSGIETLEETLSRFLRDDERLMKFFTFNPWNKGEPLLDDHNRYLRDNKVKLEKEGWDHIYIPKKEKFLITSNYHINLHLPFNSFKKADKLRLTNPDRYLITGLGISGAPMKYQYAHIRNIVDEYENYETQWEDFEIIRLGVDVGESQAKTAYELFGYDHKVRAYTIKEVYTFKPEKKENNSTNHAKHLSEFLRRMTKIRSDHYKELTLNGFIDGAAGEAIDIYYTIKNEWEKHHSSSLDWVNLRAFPEDTKKHSSWRIENRVVRWERLLTTQKLIITPNNSPMLYDELMNQPLDDMGKRDKKYDHATNASEMGMASYFKPLVRKKIKKY